MIGRVSWSVLFLFFTKDTEFALSPIMALGCDIASPQHDRTARVLFVPCAHEPDAIGVLEVIDCLTVRETLSGQDEALELLRNLRVVAFFIRI